MSEKARLMLARFPGGSSEHPASSEYMMMTLVEAGANKIIKQRRHYGGAHVTHYQTSHPDFDEVISWYMSDTPITMVRNKCLIDAQNLGVTHVLMIDSDMWPDETPIKAEDRFWPSSWRFMRNREEPAIIAAPYCGGGDIHNNIFVFHWSHATNAEHSISLEQYTREQAVMMRGIEECASIGTGLCLIDMRILERMEKPYFYYEWQTEALAEKASTEDVTFMRDASLAWHDVKHAGVFCNWGAWSYHIKPTNIGRPKFLSSETVGNRFRNVIEREGGKAHKERLVEVPYHKYPDFGKAYAGTSLIKPQSKKDILLDDIRRRIKSNAKAISNGVLEMQVNVAQDEWDTLIHHEFADLISGNINGEYINLWLNDDLKRDVGRETLARKGMSMLPDLWSMAKTTAKDCEKQDMVEVGSWCGASALEMCEKFPELTVHCVDHWKGSPNDITGTIVDSLSQKIEDPLYVTFCKNVGDLLHKRVIPWRGESTDIAKEWDRKVPMVFIDAGHEKDEVIADLEAWWPHVAEGGVICGHDWSWFATVREGVTDFFGDDFVNTEDPTVDMGYCEETWWVWKRQTPA